MSILLSYFFLLTDFAPLIHKAPDKEGNFIPIYSVVYSADGSQLIAGVGRNVVMYDAVTGTIMKNLRVHKDIVYCLAYSKNGERFASGR